MKTGETISHYKIIEKIGQGGMGVVFKAEDTKLHRTIALKFLSSQAVGSTEEKKRFLHEAQAAAALDHPNICTVHEIDESGEHTFISMAYIDGQNLSERIKKGPLKLDEALKIAIQIAEGLHAAHEKGIVHRDIKSANIMIDSKKHARITDFGLAWLSGRTRLTKTGTAPGTIAYMSPEQSRGEKVDYRTDIWSFGILLYEMICGQLPFKGDYEQAVVYSIINEPPQFVSALRSGIPLELERIINKCLAKSVDERYQHVDEILADLKSIHKKIGLEEIISPSISPRQKVEKRKFTRILIAMIIILAIVPGIIFIKPLILKKEVVVSPIPIAVISFENQTGDNNFDYLQKVIPNLLITNLEQSDYLRVMSWERMHDLLKQMGKERIEMIDKDLGFQICEIEGIDAIVLGSFTKAGNTFVTDIKVLNAVTKQILKSANVKGRGEESILETQIDNLSNEIIGSIGISEPDIEKNPLHISKVTTASLDAYHYYLRGLEDKYKWYIEDARQAFQKAISLDSEFAMAHLNLGYVYRVLGNNTSAQKSFKNAMKYAQNATEREKLYIQANYAHYVQGLPEEKLRIYLDLLKKFPHEKEVYWEIGSYYERKGKSAEAVSYYEKTLALDPEFPEALNWGAYAYSRLKNYTKALEFLQRYARVFPGDANPIGSTADIYFHMGKIDLAIEKMKDLTELKPDFYFFSVYSNLAYYYSLKEEYNNTFDRINLVKSKNSARAYWWAGLYRYWFGTYHKALDELGDASRLGWESESDWLRGWIYLDIGEYQLSRKYFDSYFNSDLAKDLRRTAHYKLCLGFLDLKQKRIESAHSRLFEVNDTIDQLDDFNKIEITFYHDLLLAELFLAQDLPERAIEVCFQLAPLEFGVPMGEVVQSDYLYYNLPFPRDVLARAYIKTGETEKAIAEYERLMNVIDLHNKERRLIRPGYHYILAQLYEENGTISKAINQYEKYVKIGNDTGGKLPKIIAAERKLSQLRN